jgi:hypothetical protein
VFFSQVSAGVAAFVQRALRKALAERFATAAEMAAALEAAISMAVGERFELFISYRVWCDTEFAHALYAAASRCQVRKTPCWPRSRSNFSLLFSCVPTGMHGPTCIFWANLTPFALPAAQRAREPAERLPRQDPDRRRPALRR